MTALSTRSPAGDLAWPSFLVEGVDGSGVLPTALELADADLWGAAYVVEAREREAWADAIGGRFRVVEHDGSVAGVLRAVLGVMSLPPVGGKPTLLVVSSGSAMREMLWAEIDRRSRVAANALTDAPVKTSPHLWDEVKDTGWWQWVSLARRWPGVLVITASSTVLDSGDYKVDVVGGTAQAVTATVRCTPGQPPALTAINRTRERLPIGGIDLHRGLAEAVEMLAGDQLAAGVTLAPLDTQVRLAAYSRLVLGVDPATDAAAKAACRRAWDQVAPVAPVDGVTMDRLVDTLVLDAADDHSDDTATTQTDPASAGSTGEAATAEGSPAPADGDLVAAQEVGEGGQGTAVPDLLSLADLAAVGEAVEAAGFSWKGILIDATEARAEVNADITDDDLPAIREMIAFHLGADQ